MNIVDSVHALLFVASEPVDLRQLAQCLGASEGQVEQALEVLQRNLNREGPIELVRIAGGYQLCTRREFTDLIANFLRPQRNRLSRSLLEVLAIVAYRQPITVGEIDRIRGVQSDYSVRSLVDRRLVHEVGRKPATGRPVLYGTTAEFLHQFHLDSLEELPPVERGGSLLDAVLGEGAEARLPMDDLVS